MSPPSSSLQSVLVLCAVRLRVRVPAAASASTVLGQGDADRLGHPLRRATSEIVVDGRVVEEAWSDALTLELRFEVWPGHNVEPPVRTEMFLTFVNPYGVQMDAINDDVAEMTRARRRSGRNCESSRRRGTCATRRRGCGTFIAR